MLDLPDPGLYRTTQPMPAHEEEFPAGVLVYLGQQTNGGGIFVVRPGDNRNNRWYWAKTLRPLPAEGFYTLPQTIELESGGRWPENALVQLGYNADGRGILFVAERRDAESANALFFGDHGIGIDDGLLARLRWAPILPVPATAEQAT
jgi:hypothetical protein